MPLALMAALLALQPAGQASHAPHPDSASGTFCRWARDRNCRLRSRRACAGSTAGSAPVPQSRRTDAQSHRKLPNQIGALWLSAGKYCQKFAWKPTTARWLQQNKHRMPKQG